MGQKDLGSLGRNAVGETGAGFQSRAGPCLQLSFAARSCAHGSSSTQNQEFGESRSEGAIEEFQQDVFTKGVANYSARKTDSGAVVAGAVLHPKRTAFDRAARL